MQESCAYRGYTISREGFEYVARPEEDAEGEEIGASEPRQLMHYIDEIWNRLENPTSSMSGWMKYWLKHGPVRFRPEEFMRRQKRRVRLIFASLAGCLVFAITSTVSATPPAWIDLDQDGEIRNEDFAIALHFVSTGEWTAHKLMKINGWLYDVHLAPSSDPKFDWNVISITPIGHDKSPLELSRNLKQLDHHNEKP
jgi:hypothetical protein